MNNPFQRSVNIVAVPMVHTTEVLFLGLVTTAQVMKEEWTGRKAQGLPSSPLEFIRKKEKQMLNERILKRWRKDALKDIISPETLATHNGVDKEFCEEEIRELSNRILRMTQELLDLHLMKK